MMVGGILVLASLPLIPMLLESLAPTSAEGGLQALRTQGTLFVVLWSLYTGFDMLS